MLNPFYAGGPYHLCELRSRTQWRRPLTAVYANLAKVIGDNQNSRRLPHSEMLPGITAVRLTDNSGLAISDLRQFADVFVWCRIEIDLELIPEILSGGGERWQAAVRAVDGFPSLGARLSKGVMLLFCS
jgi:hypothetical protein